MNGDFFSPPVGWTPYHEQEIENGGGFVDNCDFSFPDELITSGIADATWGLNNTLHLDNSGHSNNHHLHATEQHAQYQQHHSMPPPIDSNLNATSPYRHQPFHQIRPGAGGIGWKDPQSTTPLPPPPPTGETQRVPTEAAIPRILSFEAYREAKAEVQLQHRGVLGSDGSGGVGSPALPYSAAPEGGIRRGGGLGAGRSSSASQQDHIMAERKRREKLSQRFIALSAIVPGLKKMDKASVLGEAIKYIKGLQERVQSLEEQSTRHTVVVKKLKVPDDPDASCYSDGNNSDGGGTTSPGVDNNVAAGSSTNSCLPSIQVKMTVNSVLLRIQTERRKGVLLRVLAEVERLGLSVVNSSAMPFAGSVLDVTVVAQIEDGFSMSAMELMRSLNAAISQMSS